VVKEIQDVSVMYDVYCKTMTRKQNTPSYSAEFMKAFDAECFKHECRKMFAAYDEEGRIHGVIYIAYDEDWVYYLFGGTDPELRKFNSSSLLIDYALKVSAEMGRGFDFEGSITPGIEEFFRKFGGKQTPYFSISKIYSSNPVVKMAITKKISGNN